ncbi:MAG: NAD(P)H-dependent oxidoreductase subunit E [Chloroflexi bacterium HGW-Chloroflexi-1]|nr:MAG: NAD(P)H-dependent oxidoreductase subunit E [Chloroflexi bacterium HGW-Chloroflexi-1]
MNAQRVIEIIQGYDGDPTASLAILQDVQRELKYLPREALELIAQQLDMPVGYVYRLATFFKVFSLQPKGEHICKICLGTACHVKGGPLILETMERELGVKAGNTTADGKFSVEGVRCLGACALAPIIVIDDEPLGQMTPDAVVTRVRQLRAGEVVKIPAQMPVKVAVREAVDLSAVPPKG